MQPRILIVDDEESLRYTFAAFLSDEGYAVATAASLGECRSRLAEDRFDLVYMDILLGRESGLEGLRLVKERQPDCPVVIITGAPEIGTAAEAVRLGAFDYIPKPLRQETLLRVARLALQHKQLLDERTRDRARLAAIFRSVQEAILTLDGDWRLRSFNAAAERLFGLDASALERPLHETLQLSCPDCRDAIGRTLAQGTVEELQRVEIAGPGGQARVLSVVAAPLLRDEGGEREVVLTVRDETRLVGLERDLARRSGLGRLIGESRAMQAVYTLIEQLAAVDTTALVTGESGTGKELVAETLHRLSARRNGPLVRVNCAALPETLLESELFGHVRGAFTGAVADRIGRFQLADGGTIFLDEIGDISPALQVRLLRVLQEREIERVGARTPTPIDIRVIAATHRHLPELVRQGRFREDLYYRLRVVEIPLPPLRERREDIPLFTAHFLAHFNARFERRLDGVSREVADLLLRHAWPGNVRELEHVLEHAFVRCTGRVITVADLPPELAGTLRAAAGAGEEGERAALESALRRAGGNRSEAAKLLGISRRTLYRRLDELGLG